MKNIALIRTSTIKQEVESQKVEIENAIKKDNQNEIVVIGCSGASAIKLDDQYLANIREVYNTMERGDVVWAWAIDRIGRNEEVLMGFKNRLIKEGVNLVILNPSLTLLNPDGTVNAGVELAFSLFSTMAKQEMEMKKERFKRAKRRNKEDGKYIGGSVRYGYKVNPDTKKFEIDETQPVKEIFEEYANTPISCYGLARKYFSFFPTVSNVRNLRAFFYHFLKIEVYKGNKNYPRIVSDEVFDLVQEKLKNYRKNPRYRYDKAPYWCQGLIYEVCEDGSVIGLGVKRGDVAYKTNADGKGHLNININAVDSLVFHFLQRVFEKYNPSELIEEIDAQNTQIQAKKERLQRELEKLFEKDAELDERYFITGTVKNYDTLKNTLQLKIKNVQNQINDLQPLTTNIERPTLEGLDDWQVKDVFNRYISRIFVKKIDGYRTFKIDIITSLNISVGVIYQSYRLHHPHQYRLINSPKWQEIPIIRNLKSNYDKDKEEKGQ